MTKFKNKYRIESTRKNGWDYGQNGFYFITICTKNRNFYFGDITNGKLKLSPIGHIANSCWIEIPNHFPFVVLHNHIIMPNHVHGIIEIAKRNNVGTGNGAVVGNDALVDDAVVDDAIVETPKLGVSTGNNNNTVGNNANNTPPDKKRTTNATKKWKPATLGTIINQYKRACTINARKINPNFAWQSNYHDHIIRNEKSFKNISNYIAQNPLKWDEDTFNPKKK